MFVYTPYQPRQSLYKDLYIPLTSSFSSTSPRQNLQPLAMTHPDYNPFKTSGTLPAITYPFPHKPTSQARPQNEPSPRKKKKKDKEPLYLPLDPTIGASSRTPNKNMLAVDPNPPNPISSFLKNLSLENPRDPFMLPVINAIDLDLFELGLEEVIMHQAENQPIVEEDNVLHPPPHPPPPPPIFPPPPFVPNNQTRLTHSLSID